MNSVSQISDEQIAEFSTQPYDKAAMMGNTKVIGINRSHKILVNYPCGDICPDYTSRHIKVEVTSVAECDSAGGTEREESWAFGDSNTISAVCVPKVLTNKEVAAKQVW